MIPLWTTTNSKCINTGVTPAFFCANNYTIAPIWSLWMTIHIIRNTMSCPSCVSYSTMNQKILVKFQIHSCEKEHGHINKDIKNIAKQIMVILACFSGINYSRTGDTALFCLDIIWSLKCSPASQFLKVVSYTYQIAQNWGKILYQAVSQP